MRRAVFIAGVVLLLAACSPESDRSAETAQSVDDVEPAASGVSTNTGTVSVGGGMTANVSALTADVSGLNVRVTDMGTIIDLPSDALFDYDKADLTPAAEAELRKAAELIRQSPAGDIRIVGHTDSHGDNDYNQKLSEKRAKAVADWFGQQVGIRQRTFEVFGKGETAPIAPNEKVGGADDPAGRAKNRRVEVIIPTAP